jgi:hypothetical protein
MRSRALPAALALAGTLAGCKSERPATPATTDAATTTATGAPAANAAAAPATLAVTATDYRFELPAEVRAGLTTVQLTNHGKELHQAQLVKLEGGKTAKDLAQALKKPGPPPSWIKFVGGPNGIAPGQEANATAQLAPGHYAVVCFIPSPDGVMHAAKGMIQPLEVTGGAAAPSASLPAADVTMKLSDYDFKTSQSLTPGRRTILVENAGPQPHEVVLLKLAPGKSVEDFAQWAESMKGPPPAMPLGGVTFLDVGARGTFTVDLTPGDYGLICFVPDAKDGKPHFVHGMMKQVKVG